MHLRYTRALTLSLLLMNREALATAWVDSSMLTPVEDRVAVSISDVSTTVWSSLRFTSDSGIVSIVVPVPKGAAVDLSVDGWFEALENATAPRVFPPKGISSVCPGEESIDSIYETIGNIEHVESLTPYAFVLLSDWKALQLWLSDSGLEMLSGFESAFQTMTNTEFLVMQMNAPGGFAVTPTLRVTAWEDETSWPLVLSGSGDNALLITTWFLGPGAAAPSDTNEISFDAAPLVWNVADKNSNFSEIREEQLETISSFLTESANHESLSNGVLLDSGSVVVPSFVGTYFSNAYEQKDTDRDPYECELAVSALMESDSTVALACPSGNVVHQDCVEVIQTNEIDPEQFRCGSFVDDMALAMSGLVPQSTWITRKSHYVAEGNIESIWSVSFDEVDEDAYRIPEYWASSSDYSNCSGSGGTGGNSTSTSTGTNTSSTSTTKHSPGTVTTATSVQEQRTSHYVVYNDSGCSCDGTMIAGTGGYAGGYEEEHAGGSVGNAEGGYTGGSSALETSEESDGSESASGICDGDSSTSQGGSDSTSEESYESGESDTESSSSDDSDGCDGGSGGSESESESGCSVGQAHQKSTTPRQFSNGLMLILAIFMFSRRASRSLFS